MAQQVKHSFSAGELADELLGRTDLEKYDLAARRLENVVCNYSGGAFKRRGLRFVEFIQQPVGETKFFTFKFSEELADTYLIIFSPGTIRFMQGQGYVLEAAKTGTASGETFTSTAHGYLVGDLVYFTGHADAYVVRTKTTNSFTVKDIFGVTLDPPAGATEVRRVFTISNPYADTDFAEIRSYQTYDQMKFTHQSYQTYVLTRTSTTWTFAIETRNNGIPLAQTPVIATSGKRIANIRVSSTGDGYNRASRISISDPTGSGFKGELIIDEDNEVIGVTIVEAGHNYTDPTVVLTGPGSGATFEVQLANTEAGFIVAVSAIKSDGTETGITRPGIIRSSPNYTLTEGWATFTWTAVPDAIAYNVYRSLVVPNGDDIHLGFDLGYIGQVQGTSFTDNNIIPDFTKTPRRYRDPFGNGAVLSIRVTAPGSGYSSNGSVTLTQAGASGFVGYPIVKNNTIIGIYIANPGQGYTSAATLTISGGGSGATFVIITSPASGNYPAVSYNFQERSGYGGTRNKPMTLFASRIRDFGNFAESRFTTSGDPYEYTLDAKEITPIKHIIPVKSGLMVFTEGNVGLLRGADGNAASATAAVIDQQSFIGTTNVPPGLIADDLVYIQERHRGVRMLVADGGNSRTYSGQEISILARHLFEGGRTIRALAFSYSMDKHGFGIFDDGTAFAVTIDKDQQLYGFTRMSTRGRLLDTATLSVENEDHIYFLVTRGDMKTIEVMLPEPTIEPEDAIYLDASISVEKDYQPGTLTTTAMTGDVTVTCTENVFTVDMVDWVIGFAGGRGFITTWISPQVVEVTLTRPCTRFGHESVLAELSQPYTWWLNPVVETVSGIPFEGETVQIVGDGRQLEDQVVVDGAVTLSIPSAIVHVGFGFKARIVTLPITGDPRRPNDGGNVNVVEAYARLKRSGPFVVGSDPDYYEAGFRGDEAWSEPNELAREHRKSFIACGWDPDGQVEMINENGLPWEVIQLVMWYNASK